MDGGVAGAQGVDSGVEGGVAEVQGVWGRWCREARQGEPARQGAAASLKQGPLKTNVNVNEAGVGALCCGRQSPLASMLALKSYRAFMTPEDSAKMPGEATT